MKKSISHLLGITLLLLSPHLYAETAPVPVDQEPHHKLVFENDKVRIFDTSIPPGDATLYHVHTLDNIALPINNGKAFHQSLGGKPIEDSPVAGTTSYHPGNYTHRVGNLGNTPLRFILIELKPIRSSR